MTAGMSSVPLLLFHLCPWSRHLLIWVPHSRPRGKDRSSFGRCWKHPGNGEAGTGKGRHRENSHCGSHCGRWETGQGMGLGVTQLLGERLSPGSLHSMAPPADVHLAERLLGVRGSPQAEVQLLATQERECPGPLGGETPWVMVGPQRHQPHLHSQGLCLHSHPQVATAFPGAGKEKLSPLSPHPSLKPPILERNA